jgi:hypothetical protein
VQKIAPWQLALRFVLELSSLFAIGLGAHRLATGTMAWVLAIAAPAVAAVAWGTFAVKDDPSRSGNAPVAVPGWLRLTIELAVFGTGAAALALLRQWPWFAVFVAALIIHHAGTTPRLGWLLRRKG